MNTTTQPETANVTVQKVLGLGNQQPSPAKAWKVQRLGSDPVGSKRTRSAEHLSNAGDDVVRAEPRGSELCRKRAQRNTTDFDWTSIPATNLGFDLQETLEGLLKRPVV